MKAVRLTGTILLVFCLAGAVYLSLAVGTRQIPFSDFIKIFSHADAGVFDAKVIMERIPRTLFAMLAGAALGLSGLLMQAITRNPIADPGILGINSGASLAVVSGIAFFGISSAGQYIGFALVGAFATAVFVYLIGSLGRDGATPLKLALAGTATGTALTSIVSVIMMPRGHVMDSFRFWQVGSIGGAKMDSVIKLLPLVLIAVVIAFIIGPAIDVLALGDEAASGLGARPNVIRLFGAISGVILCGATTALAGPIAFVGLMVPHTVRLMYKGSFRMRLLLSAACGGILLTVSDVAGRVIGRPGELEVGIVTAFIGAPVFIIVALRGKGKG